MAGSSSFNRENEVYFAKLAERLEDYDEIIKHMKNVVMKVAELKNNEESEGNVDTLINEFIRMAQTNTFRTSEELLSIVNEYLIPSSSSPDAYVFYYTMKGNQHKYHAELKTGTDRQKQADMSLQAYETAMTTAVAELPRAHPIRLNLDLKLAVFYHSILGDTERACIAGQKTIDEAVPGLTSLSDEAKKESKQSLLDLDNNMATWTYVPLHLD